MKNIKIVIGFIALIIFGACDEDFLDKRPLDKVGSVDFFKSPKDLEAYVNQFYSFDAVTSTWGSDYSTDNQISRDISTLLEGTNIIGNAVSPDFSQVRSINYFLDNYKRIEENAKLEAYQQYLGEAYFFRARIYFSLLSTYGAIQWYSNEVGTESEELYKPRDPRNVVADNIIADLDKAAMYLTADKTDGASRINKWMALLLQSRVALFEGTWEKYHNGTPFGVNNPDPDKYFNKVVEATTTIMNSGLYDLYSTGKPNSDYYHLFNLRDYSSNKEVMFWRKYVPELGKGEPWHNWSKNYQMSMVDGHSVTKGMADSYLCTDGNPISGNPLFKGYTTLSDEMQNRDPRFYQSIAPPDAPWKVGDGTTQNWSEVYDRLNSGTEYHSPSGYILRKSYNENLIYHAYNVEETPGIIYRYAEVLLNFAEAKAELGTITQNDINISIRKLRDRVGMPNLVLADITIDPEWDFPDLSSTLNEIRRERRVELLAEGFRLFDLRRWAAFDEVIVGKRPKGFLASQIGKNPYPVDEDGFLDPYQNIIPNGYAFKIDRDYLNAIPKSQLELNPNLEQNPGWPQQ